MKTFLHKGRIRQWRGQLKDFKDLPLDVQEKFITIKSLVKEYLNTDEEIYVFGSYKHGFWDEKSDFDYLINLGFDSKIVDGYIYDKTGIKANAFQTKLKLSNILIP